MQKSSSKKPLIIGIILIVAAVFAYFYFTGTPEDTTGLVQSDNLAASDASVAGARVLTLLNQISSLQIDTTFFASPIYQSLVDHTVPIYEQEVGKTNPFYVAPARPRAR
jgi:hypothetical protein